MDIQITIRVSDQDVKDILIATLSDLHFTGFEEDEETLVGYIPNEDFVEEELNVLLNHYYLTYSKSVIKERNWNEIWESSFDPVLVDDFCIIRADFHPSNPKVEHDIIITPKMSFGTGHHATTYMMIEQMRQIDFRGKDVADFGTGTGILSILAEKLGAQNIFAVDNDEWSIDNAKENFERNGCNKITIEKANEFKTDKTFDIVLANINRNVILANFNGLVFGLKKSGKLLLSGLLKDDEQQIVDAALNHNLIHITTIEKERWVSLLFKII